jgi:hypothetical protein
MDAIAYFKENRYAWPGGYPMAAVMDDGELLCHECFIDSSNPVHMGGEADGWRVEGAIVLEGDEEDHGDCHCAHCGRDILAA